MTQNVWAAPAAILGLSLTAAACAMGGSEPPEGPRASVMFYDAQGAQVATGILEQDGVEVEVEITVDGLPAGTHGIHFHAVGRCDGSDFTSAGGHFNPANRQHGLENPAGPHNGDLPNLVVGSNGSGTYDEESERVSLTGGAGNVFDADGTAMIIHAGPDDQRTDPSGDSGARVACAIITRN